MTDDEALRRACELALRGLGDVEPNPPVGALLLSGGRPLGEGWHEHYGGPHAELRVLERAGAQARGATLIVSLEPCCSAGKTPACTQAILEAGVASVVVGCRDPHPPHRGRGLEMLRDAGLAVRDAGLPAAEALLVRFLRAARRARPHVLLKWALSRDGAVAGASRQPVTLSDGPSLDRVHLWRAHADAVLVGAGTLRADDPRLSARRGQAPVRPGCRVVLDPRLSTPPDARLLRSPGGEVWLLSRDDADPGRARALTAAGARVMGLPPGERWLRDVLARLHREGVRRLLVEGGARTQSAFLREGLADQVAVFCTPHPLGPGALPAVEGLDLSGLTPDAVASALQLHEARLVPSGADTLVRGWLAP